MLVISCLKIYCSLGAEVSTLWLLKDKIVITFRSIESHPAHLSLYDESLLDPSFRHLIYSVSLRMHLFFFHVNRRFYLFLFT